MDELIVFFLKYNCDIILFIIRIILGVILILPFSKNEKERIKNIKKYIVSSYYIIISSIIIGGYFFERGNLIVIFSICIFLCYQIIFITTKFNIASIVLLFLIIYEILEIIMYGFNIKFSTIFKFDDVVDVDYLNVYIKLIFSLILGIVMAIYLKNKKINISINLKFLIIGNYFIIGAMFGGVNYPHEILKGWEDVMIPMLNVNFSPYFYCIIIIENILVYYYIMKKRTKFIK